MTQEVFGAPAGQDYNPSGDYVPPATQHTSLLDAFREQAKPDIDVEVTYPVRHRGMHATFRAVITLDEVKKYRKAAMLGKKSEKDIDMIIANGMSLIEKNVRLYLGEPVEANIIKDEEGDDLTFRSHEFLDMMPERDHAVEALQRFLGDAQLMNMGEKLFGAAGYGVDLEPVDPIKG